VRKLWRRYPGDASGHVTGPGVFSLIPGGITPCRSAIDRKREARNRMSILWIILIVILVLALLGFFSRGRW
jgi:MFS superfamily sulfate permease-like transporter